MLIYVLLSGSILSLAILNPLAVKLSQKHQIKFHNKKIFVDKFLYIIIILCMLCLAIARDVRIGTDYKNYIYLLTELKYINWSEIVTYSNISGLEIGFSCISKLILELSNKNLMLVFSFWYILLFFLLSRFIFKFSREPLISLYIFLTLSMYNQSLNILRQYIAMAIFVYAFKYLTKNQISKYILIIILGALVHKSILITLLLVIIKKYNDDIIRNISIALVIASLVLSNLGKPIIEYLVSLTSYSNYLYKEVYSETGVGLFINIALFILLILFYKNLNKNRNRKYYLFCSAMCLSLNFFISDLGMIGRLMVFFKVFYIISLPALIEKIKPKALGFAIELCMYLLLFIYYMVSVSGSCFETSPYIFMS